MYAASELSHINFEVLPSAGADEMIPSQFRQSGFVDYLAPGANWAAAVKALREDEFALDATRLTLVCGSGGFDGTQFKNLLAADYDIQLNKTSRNSVLLQTNHKQHSQRYRPTDQGSR